MEVSGVRRSWDMERRRSALNLSFLRRSSVSSFSLWIRSFSRDMEHSPRIDTISEWSNCPGCPVGYIGSACSSAAGSSAVRAALQRMQPGNRSKNRSFDRKDLHSNFFGTSCTRFENDSHAANLEPSSLYTYSFKVNHKQSEKNSTFSSTLSAFTIKLTWSIRRTGIPLNGRRCARLLI